jgi:L-fuconolactonase
MLKIDSHQHFWIFDPVRDSWISEDMSNIRRDFTPEDLKPILEENNIAGCVAVQADQSEAETKFLLALAKKNSYIQGVIGWVDLNAEDLAEQLETYQLFPAIKGFRHIVQAEPKGFMLTGGFLNGISVLSKYGFTYDILIRSSQIREAAELVKLNPGQMFVLDHLGKPPIKTGELHNWSADITELAAHPNVYCKLSGMVTEADLTCWKPADIQPYVDTVLNVFGISRVMFGSDWPVCKLAAEYKEVCELMSNFLEQLSSKEKEQVWSANAVEFYNLETGG